MGVGLNPLLSLVACRLQWSYLEITITHSMPWPCIPACIKLSGYTGTCQCLQDERAPLYEAVAAGHEAIVRELLHALADADGGAVSSASDMQSTHHRDHSLTFSMLAQTLACTRHACCTTCCFSNVKSTGVLRQEAS